MHRDDDIRRLDSRQVTRDRKGQLRVKEEFTLKVTL
jgi:hypothetical protein